jgi:hypothetical protein
MTMNGRSHRWMIIALCTQAAAVAVGEDNTYQSRNLYPQHKMQQTSEIYSTAAKVQAANDSESRSVQQQELCKKLIQAEKYDEALKIAHEIASTPNINAERRAAHHYLIADIYNRKMQASPNAQLMQQNRQRAIQAAQEVVNQQYPAKWHVTEMASSLLKDLQDPQHMQQVADWVQKRQCNGCDTSKENFAKRQLAYMESAAKKTVGVGAGSFAAVKRTGSSLFSVFGRHSDKAAPAPAAQQQVASAGPKLDYDAPTAAQLANAKPANLNFSSPWGGNSRMGSNSTMNLPGAGKVTFSRGGESKETASLVGDQKIGYSGSAGSGSGRAPIIIDGTSIRRSTSIDSAVQTTDFASLAGQGNGTSSRFMAESSAVEVAPGVRLGGGAASTYASGQVPTRGAVKN